MSELFENQSVALDDLPKVDEQDFKAIEKKYKSFLHLRNALFFVILLGALAVFHFFNTSEIEIPLMVFLGAYGVLAFFWIISVSLVELGFPRKSYLLRNHDLLYKTGYLMQKMTAVSKNRIQHVEIRQGILLRLFKLSKLVVYTAGGNSSDLSIPGLKPEDAEILKEHISLSVSQHE